MAVLRQDRAGRPRPIRILALLFILLLSACASKTPQDGVALLEDKSAVLARINAGIPSICDYSGRVNVRYTDLYNNIASAALLQKKCEGGMNVRMLGPFGVVLAELIVDNGTYKAFQGKKDVSDSVVINGDDLLLMERYVKLPPPAPDESYLMVLDQGRYVFIKGDIVFYISTNYRTNALLTPDHQVQYQWDGDELQSLIFTRQDAALSVEFLDAWIPN